jgi:hypothetical protein
VRQVVLREVADLLASEERGKGSTIRHHTSSSSRLGDLAIEEKL